MKKFVPLLVLAVSLFALMGCNGLLHNNPLSYVTLTVKNLPAPDGDYAFVGSFTNDGWKESLRTFTLTKGNGSYTVGTDSIVTNKNFMFSVVTKGTWTRPWLGATKASTTPTGFSDGKQEDNTIRVFIPMDSNTHNITIDGSTNPMTTTVD